MPPALAEVSSPAPAATVIVPVYNGARTLGACLEAVLASEALSPLEVIVVDDGSSDASAEIAGRFACRVLRQPARRGPAAARNRGAEAAGASRIVFVDADVVVRPATLAALVATLDAAPAAFATYDPEPREPGFATALYHALSVRSLRDTASRTPVFYSYCAAIRRDELRALGGFDETFTRATFEDMELGVRLARRGALAVHRRDLEVLHAVSYDLRGLARAYFRKSRDLAELLLSRGTVTFSDQGWTHRRNWLELIGAWGTIGLAPLALLGPPLAAIPWLAAAAVFLAGALPVARTLGRRHLSWGVLAVPGLLAVYVVVTAAMAAALGSWAAGRLPPRSRTSPPARSRAAS